MQISQLNNQTSFGIRNLKFETAADLKNFTQKIGKDLNSKDAISKFWEDIRNIKTKSGPDIDEVIIGTCESYTNNPFKHWKKVPAVIIKNFHKNLPPIFEGIENKFTINSFKEAVQKAVNTAEAYRVICPNGIHFEHGINLGEKFIYT